MRIQNIAAILVMLAPVGGCDRHPAAAEAHPPLVRTFVIGKASSRKVSYTGVVRSKIEADLGFRVPGKIVERLVDPGETVRRGDALMRLDPTDFGLALSAASQRLRAAEAEAVRAIAEERRYAVLVQTSAVSRADYDRALALRRSATANLEAARAAEQQAGDEKSYTVLTADSDGLVTEVLAQPGQVVAAGNAVVKLARSGAREALVAIPETALASLPRIGTARIFGGTSSTTATLREIAGAADPLTRTYAVRFTLDSSAALPIGATVTVQVEPQAAAVAEIPLAALDDGGGGPGVWTIGTDSRVSFNPVSIVTFGDETVFVDARSIPAGSHIVALGAQLLRSGEQVRLASGEF
jgi:RND family efflux transporter MFP subunit